jgi:hypothetical protein
MDMRHPISLALGIAPKLHLVIIWHDPQALADTRRPPLEGRGSS